MAKEISFVEEEEVVEAPLPAGRQNVQPKKNVQPKTVVAVGNVAHYHAAEDEVSTWDEPCYFVKYKVKTEGGISYNGDRYIGEHILPQCQADYMGWQENQKKKYEEGIFRSKQVNRFLRHV